MENSETMGGTLETNQIIGVDWIQFGHKAFIG
jgi:hypothetical protein